jgi:MFS family permease
LARPTSRPNPWLQVLILAVVGLFAFVDRQILVLLIEPVKRDLRISDTQVSLLVGAAFIIFYTLVALPLSRLADRWSRKGVIMLGVAVWSAMTMACGLAGNFSQLFIARMGVGLGEAAFSPAAYALTAETMPVRRWGLALGALMLSASVGYGLALIGGAAILEWSQSVRGQAVPVLGELPGWKLVFVVCGALTFATLLPLSLIAGGAAAPRTAAQPRSAVWRRAWRERGAYAAVFLGIPPTSLAAYGLLAWLPSYLVRTHALTPVDVGITLGPIAIVFGGGGILAGAIAMDRLGRSRRDAPVVVGAAAIALIAASCLLLLAPASRELSLVFAALVSFAIGVSTPVPPVAVQLITPDRDRAQVSAAYLFLSGLLGMGAGPTAVALLTDRVLRSEAAVGTSMAAVGLAGCTLSVALLLAFRAAYGRLASRLADQNSDG